MTAYLIASARITLAHESVLARAANPAALDGASASAVAQAFADVRDAVTALDSPTALTEHHAAYFRTMDLFSQAFTAIAAGGIAEAIPEIEASSAAVAELALVEEAAKDVCGPSWVTVDEVRVTPTASPMTSGGFATSPVAPVASAGSF